MAIVAWAHYNDGGFGGFAQPTTNGWTFNCTVSYSDTATNLRQVDAVSISVTSAQLTSIAALKQAIANGARDWLVANKGITPAFVIVDEIALVAPN